VRVLLTGSSGYIGRVLGPRLVAAGHSVIGLDAGWYRGCDFGSETENIPVIDKDVRDISVEDLLGFDAVIHLAAVSNDPIGDLNPSTTYGINHRASVRLAVLAKQAGVERYLFSSSCSLYGKADGEQAVSEDADFFPVTAYGESKVYAERDIRGLASDNFTPTYLRNATVYGVSPRLRADLVVNNLVGFALTTGEVLMKSDGSPWRPLVHVNDVSDAFIIILEMPREKIHNESFNIGATSENYQIKDVAAIVESVVPKSTIKFSSDASPDRRSYRVDFAKARDVLNFRPQWNVEDGARQLYDAYVATSLTLDDFDGARFQRIKTIRGLIDGNLLSDDLRWQAVSV
jgi:nucleoside-diphosphate-sugar epimerase